MLIDFNEALADERHEVVAFYFSGGEPHVKIPDYEEQEVFEITARVTTWEDFGLFLAFLNALNSQSIRNGVHPVYHLYLPYYPGARQDRTDGNSPFTVGLYTRLLDQALFNCSRLHIYTFDLHSDIAFGVMKATLNNVGAVHNIGVDWLDNSYFDQDITDILIPDKGAVERANLFAAFHFPMSRRIRCEKTRTFNTGHITSYDILADTLPEGKYLVVDDICDGGATFLALADEFWKKAGPHTELQLYVSHGIFSKGYAQLEKVYSKIYTTDSFPHPFAELDHPLVEIPAPNPLPVGSTRPANQKEDLHVS